MSLIRLVPRTTLRLLVAVTALAGLLLTASTAGHTLNAHAQGSQPPMAHHQWQVNSPEGLNLRAAPSRDARMLTVIPHSTRLTLTSRSADGAWAATVYQGQSGWVDTSYLVAEAEQVELPASGRFIWPVRGRSITTSFSSAHPGIDVDQYPSGGQPVVASAAGTVTFVGGNACCSYGLYVMVEHPGGVASLYAHLQSFAVREGQAVMQGQTLGTSGNTGYSTGAHLHFELRIGGVPVDPLAHLPR